MIYVASAKRASYNLKDFPSILYSVQNKIDRLINTLLVRCDWYKFSLLAAITEATENSSQSQCICFKVKPLYQLPANTLLAYSNIRTLKNI